MQKTGDLEINQDLNFEKRSWKVERVAWVIGFLILLAALLGFLGPGPLGKATATSSDKSISVEYYRVQHNHAPAELRIHLNGSLAKDGTVRLWLDRQVAEAVEIKQVDPQPESVEISGPRFVYVFKAVEAPSTIRILFRLEPNKIGKLATQLGIVNGPELRFNQFYLP